MKMLQIFVKDSRCVIENVSVPEIRDGFVRIKVLYSCISPGTELLAFKPRKRNTFLPVGYSIAGIVVESKVEDIEVGSLVAGAGAGFANHAEFDVIPKNLVVHVPFEADLKHAATCTLGAIALHSVRRGNFSVGEIVAVYGLGVIGQIISQILISAGVSVIGIDIDKSRLKIAQKCGLKNLLNPLEDNIKDRVIEFTNGFGVDGVIYAVSSENSDILDKVFDIVRKKGKVIFTGTAGNPIKIFREKIYQKEIDFLISTSYGPGRYDYRYEIEGIDYPFQYVRWTENRNMKEYLRMIANRKINIDFLITDEVELVHVPEIYEKYLSKNKPLITVIKYPKLIKKIIKKRKKKINIAFVGLGSFARVHINNLLKLNSFFNLEVAVSSDIKNAKKFKNDYGFRKISENFSNILNDKNVDAIFICTQHENHASLVIESLKAGKHTFVEKPLAIDFNQLNKIERLLYNLDKMPVLMVGFNRRFSKFALAVKERIPNNCKIIINYRINAGALPLDYWVYKQGGRIIGEVCHFIDFCSFLINSRPISFKKIEIDKDNLAIILYYKNGGLATISYFSEGSIKMPKEYIEVNFDNKSIIIDNFQDIKCFGTEKLNFSEKKPDKGHLDELFEFYNGITSGYNPISIDSLIETTRITLLLQQWRIF